MEIFAQRLRERAKQLGISNAEAARRIGLEERRYAHYASGRREPDMATLVNIAEILGTTPNWLLGVSSKLGASKEKKELINRLLNSASNLEAGELSRIVVQVEAVDAANFQMLKE